MNCILQKGRLTVLASEYADLSKQHTITFIWENNILRLNATKCGLIVSQSKLEGNTLDPKKRHGKSGIIWIMHAIELGYRCMSLSATV